MSQYDALPTGDRVLIRPEPKAADTASGLVLVRDWEPETTGTVVAIGPRVKEDLAPGDYVIFSWQDGQEIRVDEERFFLMREGDIGAVIRSKETHGRHVA